MFKLRPVNVETLRLGPGACQSLISNDRLSKSITRATPPSTSSIPQPPTSLSSSNDHLSPPTGTIVLMVSSSQSNAPLFSQVLRKPEVSQHGASGASTPVLPRTSSRRLPPTLEDGPATVELSELGISAVHEFLVTHGANYQTICDMFPSQTRAMEFAWIINGVQHDGQHGHPHPSFIANIRTRTWKNIRASLKSLMFDSVSPFGLCHALKFGRNTGVHRLVL